MKSVVKSGVKSWCNVNDGVESGVDAEIYVEIHNNSLTTRSDTSAPSVCVPDVIGVLAVWISNQKK